LATCPDTLGCTIRKTNTTTGNGTRVERGCSDDVTHSVLCGGYDNDEGGVSIPLTPQTSNHPLLQTTQFCDCTIALCNGNWTTAAASRLATASSLLFGIAVTTAYFIFEQCFFVFFVNKTD
jgi:hypothetical protein